MVLQGATCGEEEEESCTHVLAANKALRGASLAESAASPGRKVTGQGGGVRYSTPSFPSGFM